ncbi:MAG TPA: hypothetical protein DEB46_08680 [Myxococcales bacterium]|nr:hypothetical protein [Myxococcales bacterium]
MWKPRYFGTLILTGTLLGAPTALAEDFFRPALSETIDLLEAEIEDGDGERYTDELENAKLHLEVAGDYWDQRTGGGGSFNNRQIHWGVSLRRAIRGIESMRRSRSRGGPGSLAAVERDLGTQIIAEVDQYLDILDDRSAEPGAPDYWRDDVAAAEVLLQAARAEARGEAKAEKAADAFDRVASMWESQYEAAYRTQQQLVNMQGEPTAAERDANADLGSVVNTIVALANVIQLGVKQEIDLARRTNMAGRQQLDSVYTKIIQIGDCMETMSRHFLGRGLNDREFTLCYLAVVDVVDQLRQVQGALVDTHTWLALTGHAVYAMLSVSIWYSTNALVTFEDHEIDPLFLTAADEYDEGLTELRGGDVDEALDRFIGNRCVVVRLYNQYWADPATEELAVINEAPYCTCDDGTTVNACGKCSEACDQVRWETEADWNEASHDGTEVSGDEVTLGQSSWELPFLWAANSGENTVSKINTDDGKEMGRYRMPSGCSSPSRTAVDVDGNVIVGARGGGCVVKIAVNEGDCTDRNSNGRIDTSRDVDNNGRITGGEMLATGRDECIMWTSRPGGSCARSVAIDASNNVWAGMWNRQQYHKLAPEDGRRLATVSAGGNPYGAVIDGNILWSSNRGGGTLARINVDTNQRTGLWRIPCSNMYGISVDPDGNVWIANSWCYQLSKFNPNTQRWTNFSEPVPRGVAVTSEGILYATNWNNSQVVKYDTRTNRKLGNYSLPNTRGPIGVSLGDDGNLWTINYYSWNATKFSQSGGFIRHAGVGRYPYTYSDMTGAALRTFTISSGTMTRRWDTGFANSRVHKVAWEAVIPDGGSIKIRARAGNTEAAVQDARWTQWQTGSSPADVGDATAGRFIEVQVQMAGNNNERPELRNLTVYWSRPYNWQRPED